MSQIKQILRFTLQGKSINFITKNLSISRNTVRKYLSLVQASGQSPEELLQLEDHALQQALIPEGRTGDDPRYQLLLDRYDYFCGELQRTGVSRWLLWSEYRQQTPGGYCYSQFCKHLSDLGDARNLSMANLPHPPGEQTYIDFAGQYGEYVDPGSWTSGTIATFRGASTRAASALSPPSSPLYRSYPGRLSRSKSPPA